MIEACPLPPCRKSQHSLLEDPAKQPRPYVILTPSTRRGWRVLDQHRRPAMGGYTPPTHPRPCHHHPHEAGRAPSPLPSPPPPPLSLQPPPPPPSLPWRRRRPPYRYRHDRCRRLGRLSATPTVQPSPPPARLCPRHHPLPAGHRPQPPTTQGASPCTRRTSAPLAATAAPQREIGRAHV